MEGNPAASAAINNELKMLLEEGELCQEVGRGHFNSLAIIIVIIFIIRGKLIIIVTMIIWILSKLISRWRSKRQEYWSLS